MYLLILTLILNGAEVNSVIAGEFKTESACSAERAEITVEMASNEAHMEKLKGYDKVIIDCVKQEVKLNRPEMPKIPWNGKGIG